MKRLALLLVALCGFVAGFAQTTYGMFSGDYGDLYGFGWSKMETYDVAMRIDNPSLIGKKIKAIRFPINPDTKHATDFKVWLTRELTVASSAVKPDICIDAADYKDGWNNMMVEGQLTTPFVIDGPVYVGYSMTMTEADKLADSYPVLIIDRPTEVGCWIHTTRSYRKFQDFCESDAISSAALVVLDDETVPSYAAAISPVTSDVYIGVEDPTPVSFRLYNNGIESITDIDVCVTATDPATGETMATTNRHIALSTTLAGGHIGGSAAVSFMLEAPERQGDFHMVSNVTAVNGQPNLDCAPPTEANLHVIAFAPHRRPLVEEYTGTWCGYCPRGYAGMEHMKEIYGDEFVGIAFHNGDKMEITQEFPAAEVTFPTAWMDRVQETDPYFGNTNIPFGIQNTWLERCTMPTEANIDVDATLSDDGKNLVVTSKTRFVRDVANAASKYRVIYFMTADGFTDYQTNNFDPSHAGSLGDDMEIFLQGNQQVKLTYYDVVVATSNLNGESGSIPSTVKAGREYTHKYTFKLADAKNLKGQSLMTKGITPNAVVALISTETGEIVNAAKMSYGNITGIGTVLLDPMPADGTTLPSYDLSGRAVSTPAQGSIIIKDGKKVLVK